VVQAQMEQQLVLAVGKDRPGHHSQALRVEHFASGGFAEVARFAAESHTHQLHVELLCGCIRNQWTAAQRDCRITRLNCVI
jgi:hypothetical protein